MSKTRGIYITWFIIKKKQSKNTISRQQEYRPIAILEKSSEIRQAKSLISLMAFRARTGWKTPRLTGIRSRHKRFIYRECNEINRATMSAFFASRWNATSAAFSTTFRTRGPFRDQDSREPAVSVTPEYDLFSPGQCRVNRFLVRFTGSKLGVEWNRMLRNLNYFYVQGKFANWKLIN